MAQQPLAGQGLLIIEASPSDSHNTRYVAYGRIFSLTHTPLPCVNYQLNAQCIYSIIIYITL